MFILNFENEIDGFTESRFVECQDFSITLEADRSCGVVYVDRGGEPEEFLISEGEGGYYSCKAYSASGELLKEIYPLMEE
jgi:hypothetical protein